MSKLDELIAEEERLRDEAGEAEERLRKAEHATLVERFKDVEQFAEGDIVLVPRKLFGKIKQWPARVDRVILQFHQGETRAGEKWESRSITYGVTLQSADGTFTGQRDSFYHDKVQAAPAETAA